LNIMSAPAFFLIRQYPGIALKKVE
jgi:hypothetical protein